MRPYPPIQALGAAAVMAALDRWAPLARLDGLGWAAVVPAACGIALALWAAWTMKRHATTLHPFRKADALVTAGPFGLSRNPIYLGMVMVLLGWGLWLGAASPFLVVPVFMLALGKSVIRGEEDMLARAFGAAFDDYRQKVRRWL